MHQTGILTNAKYIHAISYCVRMSIWPSQDALLKDPFTIYDYFCLGSLSLILIGDKTLIHLV